MTADTILTLRSFGVAFGEQVVLADVTLDLPRRGLTHLVGPAGSGKSTLLRTLAGLNDAHPALSTWGEAVFAGETKRPGTASPPGELLPGIGFVMQHARFFLDSVRENLVSALPNRASLEPAEQTLLVQRHLERNGLGMLATHLDGDVASLTKPIQRRLAIVRAIVAEPRLLFADEPTSGLDDEDAIDLLALLRLQARLRSILMVTHHQRFARIAGGTTILLAGGRVQEIAPTQEFFSTPKTPCGQSFVRSGSCDTTSPGATSDVLRPSATPPPPLPTIARASVRQEAPRGFFWLRPARLGGLPRPGIVRAVEHDLDGLKRLGVTTLVTLEETCTVETSLLDARGIGTIHFPIVDMSVPALEAIDALCERIDRLVIGGQVVAVHCLAGLGRTGTVLACQLVFDGQSARAAIDRVRELQPRCIQSQAQVDFLSSYEAFRRDHGARAEDTASRS